MPGSGWFFSEPNARQFGCASGVFGTEEESARNDLAAGEVGGFSGNIGPPQEERGGYTCAVLLHGELEVCKGSERLCSSQLAQGGGGQYVL